MPGRFRNLEINEEQRRIGAAQQSTSAGLPDDRYYLAQAREEDQWGRFEPALRMYTRCLEHNRAVVPAWVGQVQMLVQLGEYREARLWADKALELFRENGELLAAKSQACVRLGDHRAGMACSDGSLRSPGSSPWRWIVRGEALLASGQKFFDQCFQKALAERAVDWFDHVVIARVYLHYRQASNALRYLKSALNADPAHGYIWYQMGQCQAAIGLVGEASASYEHCLQLRSDYREAREAQRTVASVGWFRRIGRRLRRR